MAKKINNIKKYQKIKVRIDPVYQSTWFSKFTNKFMFDGKKHVVEKIIYNSLWEIKKKFRHDPLKLLVIALNKLKPFFGFIKKRLSKQWKQVPIPIGQRQQLILALKWLVLYTKTNKSPTLESRVKVMFTNFFKQKKTSLIRYRNQYQANIVKERVNTRFRWK